MGYISDNAKEQIMREDDEKALRPDRTAGRVRVDFNEAMSIPVPGRPPGSIYRATEDLSTEIDNLQTDLNELFSAIKPVLNRGKDSETEKVSLARSVGESVLEEILMDQTEKLIHIRAIIVDRLNEIDL